MQQKRIVRTFLRGRCVPRDLKVNETDAEYLVRKFDALEAKCAAQENKVIPVSTELPPANESVLLFDANGEGWLIGWRSLWYTWGQKETGEWQWTFQVGDLENVNITHWAVISAKTKRPYSTRYIADHINLSSRGGESKKRGRGPTSAGPLASLLDLPLSELTPENIAAWLSTERQNRPTVTAHAYRLLRAFIKWANYQKKYQGIIHGDIAQDHNVRKVVPVSASKAGDCLQKEQLKIWFSAVRSLNNPIASAYLQVLLLTGARREEIASLRWSDVDFKWSSMRIKDKIEGERIIPLTPYVSELLSALAQFPNSDVNKEGWVFRSNSKSGKIIEPRSGHNRALARAELPHISLHGLRRSFGTLAEWVEVPTGIVAQIMGHKPSALAEKHYRRRPLDLLRKWHEKIERWILQQANIVKK